jgi:very-short-patch-repair endonuclease
VHDPAAESGIETLVRLALRRHRVRVRSQVVVPGVGRVDFLVGERLIIEADGYDWHGGRAEFERDRERDRELVRRGYVVIRASYHQVTTDLDAIVGAALDVIRRREHRWRAIHRTQLSESGYLIDLSSMRNRYSES